MREDASDAVEAVWGFLLSVTLTECATFSSVEAVFDVLREVLLFELASDIEEVEILSL